MLVAPLWSLMAAAALFWQKNSPPADNFDHKLPVSSFGSHGRLFSIDATLNEVDQHSTGSVVSLCCRDGVVTVYTTSFSPYIHSKDLVVSHQENSLALPPFARLDPSPTRAVLAVVAGTEVDQILLRALILDIAQRSFMERNSAGSTARRIADELQLRTQAQAEGRVLVAATLLFDSKNVWKIDASGQFWKLQAAAIGKHSVEIEKAILEKTIKMAPNTKENHPNNRIATLTSSQGLAVARDAIWSVYRRFSALEKNSDETGTSDQVGLRGCVANTEGQTAIGHDFITRIESL